MSVCWTVELDSSWDLEIHFIFFLSPHNGYSKYCHGPQFLKVSYSSPTVGGWPCPQYNWERLRLLFVCACGEQLCPPACASLLLCLRGSPPFLRPLRLCALAFSSFSSFPLVSSSLPRHIKLSHLLQSWKIFFLTFLSPRVFLSSPSLIHFLKKCFICISPCFFTTPSILKP